MEYRHLGKPGIRLSELSFGSWVTFHHQADVKAAVDLMSAAYEAGVKFFRPANTVRASRQILAVRSRALTGYTIS